jgi:glucose-6-phosphate dehydrogenase assembly protein OpcA
MAAAMSDPTIQPAEVPDVPVNSSDIEKSLAELWRSETLDGEDPVTRAALWNVVAHTGNAKHHSYASETLGRAAAAVPQRSIVVRADGQAPSEMSSWISANCHLIGGGKQVCSEEIAIVAGGGHIHRIPPLVNALLIPDMPVAVWWIGDLPQEHEVYVQALLEPADRIIVDSIDFDSPSDLALIARVAASTITAPADLNWVRLEEWRVATASLFDPEPMRQRLAAIRRLRVVSTVGEKPYFGHAIEGLLYAAWIATQLGHVVEADGVHRPDGCAVEYLFENRPGEREHGSVAHVELAFEDGTSAAVSRDAARGVLTATADSVSLPDTVTRTLGRSMDDLVVRQLKRHDSDPIFRRVAPAATKLAGLLRA